MAVKKYLSNKKYLRAAGGAQAVSEAHSWLERVLTGAVLAGQRTTEVLGTIVIITGVRDTEQ